MSPQDRQSCQHSNLDTLDGCSSYPSTTVVAYNERMIRNTLEATKAATFAILLPDEKQGGMPAPKGTGFFVSGDGYFVTAAHVVTETGDANGPVRNDISKGWLMKESTPNPPGAMCQHPRLIKVVPESDFALLKVDFEKNREKEFLRGREEFPFVQVSVDELQDGEDIYAFGYPLSSSRYIEKKSITVGTTELSPRTTSAIISSSIERTKMVMTSNDVRVYVLDNHRFLLAFVDCALPREVSCVKRVPEHSVDSGKGERLAS